MNLKRNGFALLAIGLGLLLVVVSMVSGSTIIIATTRGVETLKTFETIRTYVWRVFSDFIIPLVGGIVLVYLGLEKHNLSLNEHIRRIRIGDKKAMKNEKERVINVFLSDDEKLVINMIKEDKKGALQSDIVIKTGYSKVKVHRILKSLEMKGLIKRGRLGITNRVMLSN